MLRFSKELARLGQRDATHRTGFFISRSIQTTLGMESTTTAAARYAEVIGLSTPELLRPDHELRVVESYNYMLRTTKISPQMHRHASSDVHVYISLISQNVYIFIYPPHDPPS